MKKLFVLLTDSLKTFYEKGEIKPRYYNPGGFFAEVHFISPAAVDIDALRVQALVGDAQIGRAHV